MTAVRTVVQIRLSPDEKIRWEKQAGEMGVSKWLRGLVERELAGAPVDDISTPPPFVSPAAGHFSKPSFSPDWKPVKESKKKSR